MISNSSNSVPVVRVFALGGLDEKLYEGDMKSILDWMKEHPFKEAPLLDTKEWIEKIAGEPFSYKDYTDYLTKKYADLYHLSQEDIDREKGN